MIVEWTISIGQILTAAIPLMGFIIAALGFFYALKSAIDRQGEQHTTVSNRLVVIETEVKSLAKVVIEQAVQEQKIASLTNRLDDMQHDGNEWRRWVRDRLDQKMERGR